MDPFLILLLVLGLGLIVAIVLIYNRLIALKQRCKNAFSDVDVQLRQRLELVPRIVTLVKGYMKHEREIMENLTEARTQVKEVQDSSTTANALGEKRLSAEKKLGGLMTNLFAVAENYPDLRAESTFVEAQQEFSAIEQRLAASRRLYNATVADYNTYRQQFPFNLIGAVFSFQDMRFFEVDDAERREMRRFPDINF